MILYNYYDINKSKSLEFADELTYCSHKRKEIVDGNKPISQCPNCPIGFIWETDNIEKIGQCDRCFEEFKLS